MEEDFTELDLTFRGDDNVVGSNITVVNVLVLQVLDNIEETVQKVPEFTFSVGSSDFLSFGDFVSQVVVEVFVE